MAPYSAATAAYTDIFSSLFDDPLRLAKEFLVETYYPEGSPCARLFFHQSKWLKWNGLSWEGQDESVLESEITFFVSHKFKSYAETEGAKQKKMSAALTGQVLKFLQDLCILPAQREFFSWLDDPEGKADRHYITFFNGILHIPSFLAGKPDAFRPHTPLWFSPAHLSYDYDPKALCPQWLAFLDQVLGHEDTGLVSLIQEMFGYCMTPDVGQEKFFILSGAGRNGKSTIINQLTSVVGENNVSHVSLGSFGDKFKPASTIGKLVNSMTEMGRVNQGIEETFKSFVSGEPLIFERKFQEPYSAKPTARCIFAANALPTIKDHSDGFWRRLILIPFKFQIQEESKDLALGAKLRAELPGVALWALQGLGRLQSQGYFTLPKSCAEALGEYKDNGNPLGAFLRDAFEPGDSKNEIPVKAIIDLFNYVMREDDPTLEKPSQAEVLREISHLWPTARAVRKMDISSEKKMKFVKGIKQKE